MTHFTDVHLVVDASTVAVASSVASVAATGIITGIQYYYGSKATEAKTTLEEEIKKVQTEIQNVQTDVGTVKDEMFRKEDLKDLVNEVVKKSCIPSLSQVTV